MGFLDVYSRLPHKGNRVLFLDNDLVLGLDEAQKCLFGAIVVE